MEIFFVIDYTLVMQEKHVKTNTYSLMNSHTATHKIVKQNKEAAIGPAAREAYFCLGLTK